MSNKWLLLLVASVLIVACSRSAPKLPSAKVGDHMAFVTLKNCQEINDSKQQINKERQKIEDEIKANRSYNQVVVYASGYVPPLALAAQTNEEEKKKLDELQMEYDELLINGRQSECNTKQQTLN